MPSLKQLLKFSLICTVLGFVLLAGLYISVKKDLPSVESLKTIQLQTPMKIYSNDGLLISQFGEKRRIPLKLDQMPQMMLDAILATEDNRFYQHFGVDPVGVGRAVFGKLLGQNKGGASTITMQVARNFFLTREQTYIRKIKEVFLAFHIERLLSKDEILSLYLNKIELGHRAFGVGAAAQVYYGKDIKDLTLAQIAVIAGLPKAPSTLNPITSPERAKERRSVVLQRMLVSGYITNEQYQQANNAPISAKKHGAEIELDSPYIAEMAHQKAISLLGAETAYTSGIKVFTTVKKSLQEAAQQSVIDNAHAYDERHGYRGVIKSLWQTQAVEEPITAAVVQDEITQSNGVITEPVLADGLIHPDWTFDAALAQLNDIPSYEQLSPALIVNVGEKHFDVILADGRREHIAWHNLNWARAFVDDEHQGAAPESAGDVAKSGDIVWVRHLANGQYRLSQIPQVSGALVALSPDDGAVLAAVGGYSFKKSQFNRATQAKRQVGSNIKPFIYSAALENGHTLASIVNDAPINQWDRRSGFVWRPKNSPEKYDGPIRVREALAQSKNVVSVRLLRSVGLEKMRFHLASFGFDFSELPENESLALGSASLTPLEVARGIATFANGGFLVEPFVIDRIEDANGKIIYRANPKLAMDQPEPELNPIEQEDSAELNATSEVQYADRIISSQNAFLITQAMNSAIWDSGGDWKQGTGWNGTGWRARSLKRRDLAGKTGTTNEAKDAWFSGFSRNIVATSWIGFDDHTRNLGRTVYNKNLPTSQINGTEFGAKSAQPAWIQFMETALTELPEIDFKQPDNIISVRVDKKTGKLTRKTDETSMFEYFASGTEPTEYVAQDIVSEVLDGRTIDDKVSADEDIF